MKLIAKITLVTAAGEIPPGGEVEIEDRAEADKLIAAGHAAPAGGNEPAPKGKGG